jgi:4-aminobutyrate aminotransferase-like enzyme/Ser/Thr protein kinase RdoA (MazF antagonist)
MDSTDTASRTTKPVPAEEAAELAWRHFALSGQVAPLPSERDQNYRLDAEDGSTWVLKISQSGEDSSVMDFQNRVLQRLHDRSTSIRVPRLRPTRDSRSMVEVTASPGDLHIIRLLSFLPGTPMARVRPHTPALLRDLGRVVAEIDGALVDFEHPAMHRELKWDLRHGQAAAEKFLRHVEDPRRHRLVEQFLDRYDREARPRLEAMRRSVIHGDANDHNVLVHESLEGQRVTGLIDFGDMVHSYTIGGLAIAAAYAMLDKADPLAAAGQVARGYHECFPIPEDEIDLLVDLIALRLCVSVTSAAEARIREPDNEYLGVTEAPAWRLLERLAALPAGLVTAVLRDACGGAACPRSAAVIGWLSAHRDEIGPVASADMSSAGVVDLGVDSTELAREPDREPSVALAAVLARRRAEHGSAVLVGPYGQARRLGEPAALEPADDLPEPHSVHLGIDLYFDAPTDVLAPLPGTVHDVRAASGPQGGTTVLLQHEPAPDVLFHTLYRHLEPSTLAPLAPGRTVQRGERLGAVVGPRNEGEPPHLHLQLITDPLGLGAAFPGSARPGQRRVWRCLSPDPTHLAGLPGDVRGLTHASAGQLRKRRSSHLGPTLSLAYHRPLHIVSGRGQYLYDEWGRAYLDCVNNVCHVGHCHPTVVRAGQDQMAVLNTNTRYLHEHVVRYAERLCATLPSELEVCYFVCSGSEANELALRLARTHTGGADFVVLAGGYHGNTQGLVDVSSYKFDGPGGHGAPEHVHRVPLPDTYRGSYRADDPEAARRYAEDVRDAARRAATSPRRLAGFIAEAMPGCGGQIILPEGYLAEAYGAVRDAGGVCIADEVQTGFGRPGTHFWAFQTQGVTPDIVTMGKPIGNGHPLGAVVTTRAIAQSFVTGMEYFNTFGGNPVSCAIGLAVLDVIDAEDLQARAQGVGEELRAGLGALQARHALIGDVRGAGLFVGVELVRDRSSRTPATAEATYVVNRMRDKGILLSTDGPDENVLKIKPPMVFDEQNAHDLCAALDEVLGETVLSRSIG